MLQVDKYNTKQSKNQRIQQDFASSYSTYSMVTQTSSRIDNIMNCSNKGSDEYSDDRSSTSSKSSNSSLEESSSLVISSLLKYSSSRSSSSGPTSKSHDELKFSNTIGSTTAASKAPISSSSSNTSKDSKLFTRNPVKSFHSKGKPHLPSRASSETEVATALSSKHTVRNGSASQLASQLKSSSASEVSHSSMNSDKHVLSSGTEETHDISPFSYIQHTVHAEFLLSEFISGIEVSYHKLVEKNHSLPAEDTSTKKNAKTEKMTDALKSASSLEFLNSYQENQMECDLALAYLIKNQITKMNCFMYCQKQKEMGTYVQHPQRANK
jgi:hypothetical protein